MDWHVVVEHFMALIWRPVWICAVTLALHYALPLSIPGETPLMWCRVTSYSLEVRRKSLLDVGNLINVFCYNLPTEACVPGSLKLRQRTNISFVEVS